MSVEIVDRPPRALLPCPARPVDKRCNSLEEAVAGIADGSTILISGFGECGTPNALITALIEQGAKELTIITNNAGSGEEGVAALLRAGRVRRVICSYPRSRDSVWFERRYAEGTIELELVPQGTLTERIRAAGAGIPAFYTPTGVGTLLGDEKESRIIDGRTYVLEYALGADVALLRAEKADARGNLTYHAAARNFAPTMAAAAVLSIVEVAQIIGVEGSLDPEEVVTPGIYVDRIVQAVDEAAFA
ncbi:MAG TPA: 3-oxoacid CoA-transferase subunit A [Acidimicrobiales bacterium]